MSDLAEPLTEFSEPQLVHTFSIVARDPQTGQMGVAVQSHYFSVGTVVPLVEAGVSAVATQAFSDGGLGPAMVDLMRQGISAKDSMANACVSAFFNSPTPNWETPTQNLAETSVMLSWARRASSMTRSPVAMSLSDLRCQ